MNNVYSKYSEHLNVLKSELWQLLCLNKLQHSDVQGQMRAQVHICHIVIWATGFKK